MADRDPPDLGGFRPSRQGGPASGQRPPTQREPADPRLPPARPTVAPAELPPNVEAILEPVGHDPLPRIARTGPATPHPPAARTGARRGAPVPTPRRRPAAWEESEPRRWGRIVAVTAGLLCLALGGGAAALYLYAPVDLVRDRLIAEVKARTGRDLVVGARPSVSFWPNVAVSLRDVSLSNPPGMTGPPLVTMARLDATIELWPLLSRRVVVDQLVLQQPRVSLRVDEQGRRNWDFASAILPRPVQYASAGPLSLDELPEELREFARGANDTRRMTRTAGAGDVSLGRVRIIDGRVDYVDRARGVAENAERITLTVEAPDPKAALQAAGTLVWRGEPIRLDTRVMPAQALIAGTPAQTSTAVTAGPVQITYAGTIAHDRTGPRLDGQVSARTASLAKASTWLGRPLVGIPAQGAGQLRGKLAVGGGKASLSDGALQINGFNATGTIGIETAGARPRVTGSIRVAEADIEKLATIRLLEPVAARTAPPPAPPAAGAPAKAPQTIEDLLKEPAPKAQVRGFLGRDGWSEEPLDLAALGFVDADIRIGFTRVAASEGLHAGPGNVGVTVTNRIARLVIDDLTLFDGKARGTIQLDGAAARAQLAVNVTLDNVALQPLLKAVDTDGLDGRGRILVNVTTNGRTERQMVDTLAGRVEFNVPRGAVIGFDLASAVQGLPQGRLPRFDRDPAKRTDFTDLGASFTIAKGVADNRDFRIVAREARAVGSGQIALGPRTIDFTLRSKLTTPVQAPSGLGGSGINLAGLDIPVRVTGPLAQPQVTAEFGDILKNPDQIIDAARNLDRREVENTVKGIVSGDPESKAKARDFLNNLLKR